MNSHNKDFALYFKGRENSILARGENENYINDYPKDLYIYDYKTKTSSSLISYDWFPSHAKYYLCLLYTSPSPRDGLLSRMPSSA